MDQGGQAGGEDDPPLLPSFPLEPGAAGAEPAGLQLGEFVAAAGVAPTNRELVADESAATVGENGRTARKTRTLLLAPVGREPSDSAAVCQNVGADRGVVATGGIGQAVALKGNGSAIPQEWRVVAKRWFWKPGQRALGTRKGRLEPSGTIWEKTLCSEGPSGGNRVYTRNRRRAKKFIPD